MVEVYVFLLFSLLSIGRKITQDILFRLSFLAIIKYGTDLYMITYMISYLQYWKFNCSTTFWIQTDGFL